MEQDRPRDEYRSRNEDPRREDEGRHREDGYRPRGGGGRGEGSRPTRKFERGDLRNSLRERRAAREVTLSKPVTSSYRYPRYVSFCLLSVCVYCPSVCVCLQSVCLCVSTVLMSVCVYCPYVCVCLLSFCLCVCVYCLSVCPLFSLFLQLVLVHSVVFQWRSLFSCYKSTKIKFRAAQVAKRDEIPR